MRLIDADKLEAYRNTIVPKNRISEAYLLGAKDVFKYIDLMPTVDAVPVKHGKWMLYYDIEQGRALRCSECKMVFWVGDGREGNFCPNCGAKMDGEANETV